MMFLMSASPVFAVVSSGAAMPPRVVERRVNGPDAFKGYVPAGHDEALVRARQLAAACGGSVENDSSSVSVPV